MSILGRYADQLADSLRDVPGTRLVDIYGESVEEVLVQLDPELLAAAALTTDRVASAIRAADAKVQAGRVRAAESDLLIGVQGEILDLDRIRRIVLREGNEGQVLRLSDIATISRGVREPAQSHAIVNGKVAILLAAKINEGLQIDVWTQRAKSTLAQFQRQLPASIDAQLVFEQSSYTQQRLREVAGNMIIGILLIVVVLLLSLGWRAAMIVALVLPLVSLGTLATMNAMGLPIHQMSVTGLIVALGLLVDSAIVMTDETRRRLQLGMDRLVAVRYSVRRLAAPLTASTLTTAFAFTPMILLPGPPGDFVGSIAIAVVIMLAWSLFIALTITPAIAGRLLPTSERKGWWHVGIGSGRVGIWFRASLSWSVRYPWQSIPLALVLPLMGFISFPVLTAQFFPGVERDQFHIEVELADGTAINRTLEITHLIDAQLREYEGIEQINWVVGKSAPAFYYNIIGFRDNAPGFSQALITTRSAETTASLIMPLQEHLNERFPEARILVRGLVQGPPVNAPVEFKLIGPDLELLRELGDSARALLLGLEPVTMVRTSLEGGAPKVDIDIDESAARLLGLDSLVEASEQLPVRVRFGEGLRADLTRIGNLPILPPNAEAILQRGGVPAVPLSAIADIRLIPAPSPINRLDGERINTVQAFLQRDVLPEEALQLARKALEDSGFAVPPGYRLEFGGDSDARNDTVTNLLASLGLIVTLSIATIVLTFNSFRLSLITFIVGGLSAGLSLLSLAVFNYPFGVTAIIGVIGSIGVSINAALIILTGLQRNAAARNGSREAMVDVVMGSSRHILSTTITTFGGFLPLIIAGGGFWPPFAMAIAGGVLLSSVVSFYFTPPMFALFGRFGTRSKERLGNHSGFRSLVDA